MRWRDLLTLQQSQPVPPDFLSKARHVHFLGIGGIGMSALAFFLLARGHRVSGSDENQGRQQIKLQQAGAHVFLGHQAQNIGEADALCYSSAIEADNPELRAARQKGVPCFHRAQLLAHLSNAAQTSIAVSGTHGKSTTSALIAHLLERTGHNPSAILGAVYPPFGGNFRVGSPELIVVEADESDGSFTLLRPSVALVLNVEPEHLENYDDSPEELWRAFEMFCQGATRTVLNQNAGLRRLNEGPFSVSYGFSAGKYNASQVVAHPGRIEFDLKFISAPQGRYALRVPGKHNVSNALGALAACQTAMGTTSTLRLRGLARHLETFIGTLRRFEYKGQARGVVVYDDYGHHPTELRATLEAASEFLERPLCVIFQPHRFSRTQALWREFAGAFTSANKIIITEIYSAHEAPIEGVSGRLIFDAVRATNADKPVYYAENLDEAKDLALELCDEGDAILTMGAGNITRLGPQILEALSDL